jgi:hypothetical protein
MRLVSTIRSVRGAVLLAVLAACVAALWAGAGVARAAAEPTAPWSPTVLPWGSSWRANDVCAFGATNLAMAGDDGRIAVSRDAGLSWKVVVPDGFSTTAFTAISLGTTGRGAVASGGRILVTTDFGATWSVAKYTGPGPGAPISDIAQRGPRFLAVGDDGMIMSSDNGGATWRRSDSPTQSALTCVAIAGDGTALAGSEAGEILVGAGDTLAVVGAAPDPVTSVAAASSPAWNDGVPDLVAASGSDLLGSDDGLSFATLPGLPDAGSKPWSRVAWPGVPEGALLVAGAAKAGFLETVTRQWVAGESGISFAVRAAAPAGQSVGYLLGSDGSLVRTLSAGREPATVSLSPSRIKIGESARLRATVHVGAPGEVLLRRRTPGGAWKTVRTIAWTAADWDKKLSFTLDPTQNQEYALSFRYGETVTALMPTAKLVVVPKVRTARSQYNLRVGDIFRFSGTVSPKLSGERVELYTNRGGRWRPVAGQRSVSLKDGRTWSSRQFGATRPETYRLRAHLTSTRKHAEAWSRTVTVTIR